MTEKEITKLLDAWRQAFWYFREDIGIGDSFKVESERLEKNLAKLECDLKIGCPTTPGKIRSFLMTYSVMTPELEDILTLIEKNIGVKYSESENLDYSEYLEY